LPGLAEVGRRLPAERAAILAVAAPFLDHPKGVVRKAAKTLQKPLAQ